MRRTLLALTGVIAVAAASGAAAAHRPYLAPTSFSPTRDFVTVHAGLTEGALFVADLPLRATGDFLLTSPDGATSKAGPGVVLKEYTYLEAALPAEGTWRISTGDRPGRTFKFAKVGGKWAQIGAAGEPGMATVAENAIPAGAERMDALRFTKAEAYVTRGKPSTGALKAQGKGFELTPAANPTETFVGKPFRFTFTSDGKPAAGQAFVVERAGDAYAAKKFMVEGRTDAQGRGELTFKEPGIYLLQSTYEGAGRPGGQPAASTVFYSLAFEVTP